VLAALQAGAADAALDVEDVRLASDGAPIVARRYRPRGAAGAPGIVLQHGLHPRGYDEPRLVAFARALAAQGFDVLTPDLAALREARLGPAIARALGDAAAHHARAVGARDVVVVAISFAGGLALVAATDAHDARAMRGVCAVGAHADVRRVARFLVGRPRQAFDVPRDAGAWLPRDYAPAPPNPYGARVLAWRYAERLAAPEDAPGLRAILDLVVRDDFRAARERARAASPEVRATVEALLAPGPLDEAVAARLLAAVDADADALDAASPRGKLRALRVPVLLLHGADDPVVPASETAALAAEAPPARREAVLVTRAIRHAEVAGGDADGGAWEKMRLVAFVARLLALAER
jgi:pimeloyl-ACP methyl ester carboxylesterase